ncbi:MAG TPA: hypothetical protein VHQ42_05470 [Candidatus Limnocylindria bacterium]|nr:hypothetical protein [Candidatus Limnocylindria bacterium]
MPLLAYIDPGSGSMLLQVLLAGVLAVPFFFRRVISDAWHRVRGGKPDETVTAASAGDEETDSRR